MTTKTMLSVERELLAECAELLELHDGNEGASREAYAAKDLRALLDEPAQPVPECVGDLERFEADDGVFVRLGDVIDMLANEKAAQHQGEPVARIEIGADRNAAISVTDNKWLRALKDRGEHHIAPLYAEQPAPVAVVPEGYCIMPRRLTAENGAKALLLGEFKLRVTKECSECCELEEPTEGCSMCDGEGEYEQRHTIPWDQIKFIYSQAVAGLARISKPL